jgi:hypothetical protein
MPIKIKSKSLNRKSRKMKGGSVRRSNFRRSARVAPNPTLGPIEKMTSKWNPEYILIHHNCPGNDTHRKDILLRKLVFNSDIYYHHIPTNEVYFIDNFIDGERIEIDYDDWSAHAVEQGNFKNVRSDEINKYMKLGYIFSECLKITICCYPIRPYGKFIKRAYRKGVIKKF